MKITILLLLTCVMNTIANNSYSQTAKVTLNLKNASVEEVLNEIEKKSDYYFLLNQKQVDINRRVDVVVENSPIKDVLARIFKNEDVNYLVYDRQIILTPKEKTFLPEMQQQKKISGKVTDNSGQPLTGVTVAISGTQKAVITDAYGMYSLPLNANDKVISFSFIGMKKQEVILDGQAIINVSLESEAKTLEEVVVIGYGTQKKANVIGSVTTVTSKELNSAPVSMISNAIAGRLAGAIVQQGSGEPGNNSATILIRGKATLGNNSPLVVVDGIAGRDMNSLQSTDIESITVLKDASAAIYGARAANGVILITTKHGAEDTPLTFNYGFYQGQLSPTKLPEMVDAGTYAQMIREMQSYRNVAESNMQYSLADIEKYKSGKYPWTHPNTDWFAEALKAHSTTRNHNLSVSGGSKVVTYYGSFGSQFDDGIYKNSASSYNRNNLKVSIDAKVNKFFSVGVDMNGSQENTMSPSRGQLVVYRAIMFGKPTLPAFFPNGLPSISNEKGENPVVISGLDAGFNNRKTYRLNTKISATLNVPGVSGLTLSGYYAYDKYLSVNKLFQKPYTLYSLDKQAYLNAGNTGVEDGSAFLKANFLQGLSPDPNLNDDYSDSDTKVFNLKANYDKTIGGVHNVSVFVSMENSNYLSQGISAFRRYFTSDELPYLFAGSNTAWTNNGFVSLDASINYFGRVMYNYKETYLLQFSLRRDGSIRFSKESGRWGTFPSILAGWRISNENFWKKNIKFIDYFKLKASFGQMGNDQVLPFQYLTSYAFGTGAVFGSSVYSSGLVQSGNPNPFITWEVANVFNAGFESTFLNNKMTFNTDFFYQRRSNILVKKNASVPDFTGIVLPDQNFGIVDNKGFELQLGYNDHKGDFSYGINGNIAFARNTVVAFDEPAVTVPWQRRTGHPQGALLLYKSAGIFRDIEQVNSLPHVAGARPGDIIIEDYDKNGKINSDDRILFDHTADPEITYGLSFNLSYKNWDLTALIQGVGTTMRNSITTNYQSGTAAPYFAFEAVDRWTVNNINASKPRAYEGQEEYWRTSYPTDYNYQNGGYGRLKNLQLSYSFPKRFLKVAMIKDFQLYFSGENLLLIYSQNKIMDPEITNMDFYPIMKSYTLGIKVAF